MEIVGDVEGVCPHGCRDDSSDLMGDVPGVSEAGDELQFQEPGDVDTEAEQQRGQGVHQRPGHPGGGQLQLAVGQGSKSIGQGSTAQYKLKSLFQNYCSHKHQ